MRNKKIIILGLALFSFYSLSVSATEDYRGIRIRAKDGEVLQPFERSWALVIGINDYRYVEKLRFAVSDATAVKQMLQGKYDFAADHIFTLYDSQATKRKILQTLGDELPYKIGERDRLIVYFAGHGETSLDNGYLIPVDYRQGEYRASAISMTELKDILKDIKAKHIYLVLDACYSGMFFTQRAAVVKDEHPRYLREITRRKARQAITAGGKEPVSDSGYQNHSAFTGIFLEALDTGYADYNGDGIITASEINAYIQPKVAELADQTPEFGSLPGSEGGEFVFVLSDTVMLKQPKKMQQILKIPKIKETSKDKEESKNALELALAQLMKIKEENKKPKVDLQQKFKQLLFDVKRYQRIEDSGLDKTTKLAALDTIKTKYPEWASKANNSMEIIIHALDQDKDGSLFKLVKAEGIKVTFTNSVGMKFVYIPPAHFMMGSPSNEAGRGDDEKRHRVNLTSGFYLQTTEVTQGQWQAVMGDNPSRFKNCGDDCPVEEVSWNDVRKFISKLNRLEGESKYRLPAEAEWEYACRAGNTGKFSFGDDENSLGEYAWYTKNSGSQTHPVGRKNPNAWGLYDMHGNVWEWCQDWKGSYSSNYATNPTGPAGGLSRVTRGGGWYSVSLNVRCAHRRYFWPGDLSHALGFRLLRTL